MLCSALRPVVVACGLVASIANAQTAQSLFDGSSLDGWTGDPKVWSVQDGCIVGSSVDAPVRANTFLVWAPADGGLVEDFELTFEARLEGDNNSGVQYRSRWKDRERWRLSGYQADLHPSPNYVGMLYDEGGLGIVAQRGQRVEVSDAAKGKRPLDPLTAAADRAAIDVGEWHAFRIVARGGRLRHWVDGEPTVDVFDDRAARPRTGLIGLQVHAGKPMTARFRNLVLTRFGDVPVPAPAAAGGEAASAAAPEWIWSERAAGGQRLDLERAFEIGDVDSVERVEILATCDNGFELKLNDRSVLSGEEWTRVESRRLTAAALRSGTNRLVARVTNEGGPAGFVAQLRWTLADGSVHTLVTDKAWRVRGANGGEPQAVRTFGAVGGSGQPWSGAVTRGDFGFTGAALPVQRVRRATDLQFGDGVDDGFVVEELYAVPRDAGSWVALATDERGRLYAADQRRGLYVVEPAAVGADVAAGTTVRRVDVSIGGAQGLVWAFDALYVVVNGGGSGLYRLTDTDGDGELDRKEKLREFKGGGEHGPHAVVVSPDGKGLLVVGGNHTEVPALDASRLSQRWALDVTLPRIWDVRGHAHGRLAPGGWICRTDPNGATWELVSAGYRNAYDVAVSPAGDLFTYDADMEWDMGMPWYRPTRICHAVSGSEFGWRAGSAKWPSHWPDTLPAVVDIGPGSPTGVVHGHGLRGPARYREAVFALDWTFGTVWAVHLEADGGTFRGDAEVFLHGKPFPLTDAVVGDEGALYLTVGGRGLPARLLRVRWNGDDAAVDATAAASAPGRAGTLRRELEGLHGGRVDAKALDAVWPALDDADRFVRYAARTAVEAQPVATWRERALAETRPRALVEALVALARHGEAADRSAVLAALARLSVEQLAGDAVLAGGAARAYELTWLRLGEFSDEERATAIARLDPLCPHADDGVNRDLTTLLAKFGAPSAIEKTLRSMETAATPTPDRWRELVARNARYGRPIARMLESMPPTSGIHYARVLASIDSGWTVAQRRRLFEFFLRASEHPGGNSYAGFLELVRLEALATCTPNELEALGDLTSRSLIQRPDFDVRPPKGPARAWTLDAAVAAVDGKLDAGDRASGRNLFHATACASCHRFNGEGGDLGPDLSSLGNRFGARDVLESIVEPGKVVSDQYRVVMPPGLANALNETELRDLLAYLLGKGS